MLYKRIRKMGFRQIRTSTSLHQVFLPPSHPYHIQCGHCLFLFQPVTNVAARCVQPWCVSPGGAESRRGKRAESSGQATGFKLDDLAPFDGSWVLKSFPNWGESTSNVYYHRDLTYIHINVGIYIYMYICIYIYTLCIYIYTYVYLCIYR